MPECRKCSAHFPFKVKIDGKTRNLVNRRFCLECSPFGGGNTVDLARRPAGSDTEKWCSNCETLRPVELFYKRAGRPHGYCRDCHNALTVKRHQDSKLRAVEYKGGKCENAECGYAKSVSALEFHHTSPEHKDFSISDTRLRSWEALKAELDKCKLLCANCHREEHDKLRNKQKHD